MLEGVLDLGTGRHLPVAHRTRHRRADEPGPTRSAGHRGPGALLRPHRPAARVGRRTDGQRHRSSGESFHIGRLAVSGPDHEPLVVDWRAPVAEPFYRATGLDPQGLARRRHLAVRGRERARSRGRVLRRPRRGGPRPPVRPASRRTGGRDGDSRRRRAPPLRRAGAGRPRRPALRARPGAHRPHGRHRGHHPARAGRDHPVPAGRRARRPGRPGTGKTAVALHRAAYLLYTHRFPLERQGVLVVGPNPLFLRYIEQVLPSLGETGVSLSTVAGLVPEVRGPRRRRRRRWPSSRVMCGWSRCWPAPCGRGSARCATTWRCPSGPACCACAPRATEEIVAMARRRPGTHNARRRFVETQVVRVARRRVPRPGSAAGRDGCADDEGAERGGAGRPGAASAAGPRGRGSTGPHVAAALASRVPPRPPRRTAAAGRRGQGHPDLDRGAAPLPAPQCRPRRRPVDGRRHGADRRGPHPARPTPRGPAEPGTPRAAPRGGGGQDGGILAAGTGGLPPARRRAAGTGTRRRDPLASGTSSSTRSRTSRPCSCACWPGGRCRAP